MNKRNTITLTVNGKPAVFDTSKIVAIKPPPCKSDRGCVVMLVAHEGLWVYEDFDDVVQQVFG